MLDAVVVGEAGSWNDAFQEVDAAMVAEIGLVEVEEIVIAVVGPDMGSVVLADAWKGVGVHL